MKPEINTLFDNRYLLIQKIGSGGFAEVWKAEDIEVKIIAALKIFIQLDKEGVEYAKIDFKNSADVSHSHVIKIRHYAICDNQPYLVMNLCEGTALQRAGKYEEKELVK